MEARTLELEQQREIKRLKNIFDYSDIKSLEHSIKEFDEQAKSHIRRRRAEIESAKSKDLKRVAAIADSTAETLKLQSIAALEAGVDASQMSQILSGRLLRLGMLLAELEEFYKKERLAAMELSAMLQ